MASLRVAINYTNGTGGFGGYGHSQILVGTQEIEVQAGFAIVFGSWVFEDIQDHASNTSNFGDPDKYAVHTLDFSNSSRTPESVLDIWLQVRQQMIQAQANGNPFEYDAAYNSNTFVNTLLFTTGLSLSTSIIRATPPDVGGGLPGFEKVAIQGLRYASDAIDLSLVGGQTIDIIQTGNGDDTISGLQGNDWLNGFGGNDTLDGGEGFDTIDYSALFRTESASDLQALDIRVGQNSQSQNPHERAESIDIVNDGRGGRDALLNVEYVFGTDNVDNVAYTGGDNGFSTDNGVVFSTRNGADTFEIDVEQGTQKLIFGGGAEVDTFNISASDTFQATNQPIFLWGGDGADIFNFTGWGDLPSNEYFFPGDAHAPRILSVTLNELLTENLPSGETPESMFERLDYAELLTQVQGRYLAGQIDPMTESIILTGVTPDIVIINGEADDVIQFDGQTLSGATRGVIDSNTIDNENLDGLPFLFNENDLPYGLSYGELKYGVINVESQTNNGATTFQRVYPEDIPPGVGGQLRIRTDEFVRYQETGQSETFGHKDGSTIYTAGIAAAEGLSNTVLNVEQEGGSGGLEIQGLFNGQFGVTLEGNGPSYVQTGTRTTSIATEWANLPPGVPFEERIPIDQDTGLFAIDPLTNSTFLNRNVGEAIAFEDLAPESLNSSGEDLIDGAYLSSTTGLVIDGDVFRDPEPDPDPNPDPDPAPGPDPDPDINSAPVITSGGGGTETLVQFAENTSDTVYNAQATDTRDREGAGLVYSIFSSDNGGGEDGDLFAIDTTTGALTFLSPPDFDAPEDADTDNQYVVSVRVTDSDGNTDTQRVIVLVTDANGPAVSLVRSDVLINTFSSIQAAVNAAQSGDDILVNPEAYEAARISGENVNVGVDDLTINIPAFSDALYNSTLTLTDNVSNISLNGDAAPAVVGNAGINRIVGNDGDNAINGGAGNDVLIGNEGDDALNGMGGVDRMEGGTGSDGYRVDNTEDRVIEEYNTGEFDIVRTSVDYTLPNNVEILIQLGSAGAIDGTGNDGNGDISNLFIGNDFNNMLTTYDGNDVILGRGGDDTIVSGRSLPGGFDIISGGDGADILIGDLGHDYFVYQSATEAGDTIADFTTGDALNNDILDLRSFGFSGLADGLLSRDAIVSGHLRLEEDTVRGDTRVFVDVDGSAGPEGEVQLAYLEGITASEVQDYILI